MRFVKLQSLGNDFLLLDPEDWGDIPDLGEFVRRLCDRHTGIGADGILLVTVTDRVRAEASFRILNADGSEAETSGNGLRCAAAGLFYEKEIEPPGLVFTSRTGRREARLVGREGPRFEVRVEMGAPRFDPASIPFDDGRPHERLVDYPLAVGPRTLRLTMVSMGNPHAVLFVDPLPEPAELREIGRAIETHPSFPNRTNVEFVRVRNKGEIEVRFWERGVGQTLASGSGSSAAAAAAALKGLTARTVRVVTALGSLAVEWTGDKLFQTGTAELVFEGTPLWESGSLD
jgi:diaminopimelate epimerase